MDRMRESVFAVLGDLSGFSFLDLFAGSGIIALEAASRGAAYIEAVEADKLKAAVLLANAAISPVPIRCRFMPAERYVKRARRCFHIIFCDPPFSYRHKSALLASIAASALTGASDSPAHKPMIILHRPNSERPDPAPGFSVRETRRYGNSAVDFFGGEP
jgi:16S rRNA (guanine(966)-N(2))-methyltransferase RsmD